MSNEDLSILEEINRELKNDQQLEFLKKNKIAVLSVIAATVVGIIIYSSWYERRVKSMEDITNALLNIMQNPSEQSGLMLSELINTAPAELRSILMVMKSGKKLAAGDYIEENLQPLLDLSQKGGVDQIWKDLAIIVYGSYPVTTKTPTQLIELLDPLTIDGRPFRFTALEIKGMILVSEGKHKEALDCFNKILKSTEAPGALKERIRMLYTYIRESAKLPESKASVDNNSKTSQKTEA